MNNDRLTIPQDRSIKVPSKRVQVSLGCCVQQRYDRVPAALVNDPPWVELAHEPRGVVITMEIKNPDELLAKREASHGAPVLIDGRGVDADAHRVWQDHHHGAGFAGFPGQADFESKLTRVFIESTAVEQGQDIPASFWIDHSFFGDGTNASVCKCCPNNSQSLARDFHGTALKLAIWTILYYGLDLLHISLTWYQKSRQSLMLEPFGKHLCSFM